ncbi:hypothetical protein C5C07_17140 [Haloferax sp. Atlit-4N]|uniref:hypothetical protein n=1 Tax=Haloferax sp. Atlit-4N TaxID=2077206 RepID=UPI000E361B7B|nr:hypothetical protein [Haloferax sp. Atlit-4N]RDZ51320.1 hypothetical protein C5C07_17140 [Haloferax sp. Atlit-4N]
MDAIVLDEPDGPTSLRQAAVETPTAKRPADASAKSSNVSQFSHDGSAWENPLIPSAATFVTRRGEVHRR